MLTAFCNIVHVLVRTNARTHLRLSVELFRAGCWSTWSILHHAWYRAVGDRITRGVTVVYWHGAVHEGDVVVWEGLADRRCIIALSVGTEGVDAAGDAQAIATAKAERVQAVQLRKLSLMVHRILMIVVQRVVL